MSERDYAVILQSKVCWCGRSKREGHAVCAACWRKLNGQQRDSLYVALRAGFAEAYERVVEHLRHHTHGAHPIASAREAAAR